MDHIRDKLIQVKKICVYIFLSWQGILTFGFCSLGIFLYYRISWIPLQTILARILVVTLKFWGHSASRGRLGIFLVWPSCLDRGWFYLFDAGYPFSATELRTARWTKTGLWIPCRSKTRDSHPLKSTENGPSPVYVS